MKKLEKMKQERTHLDIQIQEIEENEMEEKLLPAMKKNIGKCYVYVNSYGGGFGSEKWNLYTRVISVTDNAHYLVDRFQHTSDGLIEIEKSRTQHNYLGRDFFNRSDYKEIDIEEYQQAQKDLIKIVRKVLT